MPVYIIIVHSDTTSLLGFTHISIICCITEHAYEQYNVLAYCISGVRYLKLEPLIKDIQLEKNVSHLLVSVTRKPKRGVRPNSPPWAPMYRPV